MKLIRDLLHLNEAKVEGNLEIKSLSSLSTGEIVDILHKSCSKVMEYLCTSTSDFPALYRGDASIAGSCMISTKGSTRKSTTDSNFHNLIIDNTPSLVGFPKRSSSVIVASSFHTASFYSSKVFYIVPFDNAKVSTAKMYDLIHQNVKFMGLNVHLSILAVSRIFKDAGVKDTWEGIHEFAKVLAEDGPKAVKAQRTFARACRMNYVPEDDLKKVLEVAKTDLMAGIDRTFAPSSSKFSWKYGRDLKSVLTDRDTELWIEGKMFALKDKDYKNVLDNYREKYL